MSTYYVHPRYRTASVIITPDSPVVVEEEPKPVAVAPAKKTTATVVRSLPCINLGSRVDNGCTSCWKNKFHHCEIKEDKCRPAVECQKCVDYIADSPTTDI